MLLLTGCIDEPRGDTGLDDDGIVLEEGEETGDQEPDLPDESGDGDGDDHEKPPTCEATTAIASAVPPNVMLVIDKSRSMLNYTWDHDGLAQTPEVTRWYSLHGTVDSITNQYQYGMNLGLTLFPSVEADSSYGACLVNDSPEVAVGIGNAEAILAAIPGATDMSFQGATPAAAGIATALTHLEMLDDGLPAAMILITDGAANCGLGTEGLERFTLYDEDLPLLVADAWERAGIPTYVIGIDIEEVSQSPFTNPREKLDEVAQLGGVPRPGEVGFYDATSADALMTALDQIASSVSCNVQLGKAPSGPDQLVVSIDGEIIPQLDSCEQGDGWIFSGLDGALDRIELCNGSCEALLDVGEIEAEFLCPPQP